MAHDSLDEMAVQFREQLTDVFGPFETFSDVLSQRRTEPRQIFGVIPTSGVMRGVTPYSANRFPANATPPSTSHCLQEMRNVAPLIPPLHLGANDNENGCTSEASSSYSNVNDEENEGGRKKRKREGDDDGPNRRKEKKEDNKMIRDLFDDDNEEGKVDWKGSSSGNSSRIRKMVMNMQVEPLLPPIDVDRLSKKKEDDEDEKERKKEERRRKEREEEEERIRRKEEDEERRKKKEDGGDKKKRDEDDDRKKRRSDDDDRKKKRDDDDRRKKKEDDRDKDKRRNNDDEKKMKKEDVDKDEEDRRLRKERKRKEKEERRKKEEDEKKKEDDRKKKDDDRKKKEEDDKKIEQEKEAARLEEEKKEMERVKKEAEMKMKEEEERKKMEEEDQKKKEAEDKKKEEDERIRKEKKKEEEKKRLKEEEREKRRKEEEKAKKDMKGILVLNGLSPGKIEILKEKEKERKKRENGEVPDLFNADPSSPWNGLKKKEEEKKKERKDEKEKDEDKKKGKTDEKKKERVEEKKKEKDEDKKKDKDLEKKKEKEEERMKEKKKKKDIERVIKKDVSARSSPLSSKNSSRVATPIPSLLSLPSIASHHHDTPSTSSSLISFPHCPSSSCLAADLVPTSISQLELRSDYEECTTFAKEKKHRGDASGDRVIRFFHYMESCAYFVLSASSFHPSKSNDRDLGMAYSIFQDTANLVKHAMVLFEKEGGQHLQSRVKILCLRTQSILNYHMYFVRSNKIPRRSEHLATLESQVQEMPKVSPKKEENGMKSGGGGKEIKKEDKSGSTPSSSTTSTTSASNSVTMPMSLWKMKLSQVQTLSHLEMAHLFWNDSIKSVSTPEKHYFNAIDNLILTACDWGCPLHVASSNLHLATFINTTISWMRMEYEGEKP